MKSKIIILFSFISISLFAQVPKENVVIEKFTGIYCGACPTAVHNVHDLIENEDAQVIVVSYHSASTYSDPLFENPDAHGRNQYYASDISGYPTTIFDGIDIPDYTDGYQGFVDSYNNRKDLLSPVSIDLSYIWNGGTSYSANITITKESEITSTDLRLQLALTQTNIDFSWMGEEKLYDVVEQMLPDYNGTSLDFSGNDEITLDFDFELENGWDPDYMKLLAFVQDHQTKEIFQGDKILLRNATETNDASPDMILELSDNYCGNNMAPVVRIRNSAGTNLTSLQIAYSINNSAEQTLDWTGDLAPFEQEVVYLDNISFSPQATDNVLYIETRLPNGSADEDDSNDEITHEFNSSQVIGTKPRIEFRTDEWPFLNSWELRDAEENIVAQSSNLDSYTVYTEEFDLSEGCYSFTMFDETGNGFSNWTGEDGYFIFYDDDGNELINIVDFGYELNILFEASLSVGIENQNSEKQVQLYPNPTVDILNIKNAKQSQINIYDMLGNIVFEQLNMDDYIDISALVTGAYTVEVITNDKETFRKVIIKH